jgi:geranylgeranyl diphosphate synthase type II
VIFINYALKCWPSIRGLPQAERVIKESYRPQDAWAWVLVRGWNLGNGQQSTLKEIENVHRKKTGALLIASARLGAILGGGSETEIDLLTKYAEYLGLAFQIQDDILDVTGQSEILGKPTGSDQKLAKSTYPSFLGLSGANKHLKRTIALAKEQLPYFGTRADFLISLADYVAERNS